MIRTVVRAGTWDYSSPMLCLPTCKRGRVPWIAFPHIGARIIRRRKV